MSVRSHETLQPNLDVSRLSLNFKTSTCELAPLLPTLQFFHGHASEIHLLPILHNNAIVDAHKAR